jgi:hypothetical protein
MEAALKPFKDTKLGQFLSQKAPSIISTVGNVLPDNGLLGVVKNLIGSHPDLTPEEKSQALQMVQEFSLQSFTAEATDRDSARKREMAMGGKNLTQNILAFVGVIGFFVIAAFVLSHGLSEMSSQSSFIVGNLTGIAGTIVMAIYGYYFGSSIGSRNKEDILDKVQGPAK